MKRQALRIILSTLTVPLLLTALWTWSRLRGPTAEQREALALMTETQEPAGRNAFAALWTLPYDVPEEEQAVVVAEDAAYWRDAAPYDVWGDDGDEHDILFTHARGKYPELGFSEADNALLCKGREEECLKRVRDDPEAYAGLLARNSRLFERVAALSDYDYYRNELPHRLEVPFPPFQYGSALAARHALWFVRDERDAALDGVCSDISTWRRLGAYSDSLIARIIGVTYSSYGNSHLLADMLSELARDYPLPSSCDTLRDPPGVDELEMCEVMRGEHRYLANAMREMVDHRRADSWYAKLFSSLFFDPHMTTAEFATSLAPYCGDNMRYLMEADEPAVSSNWSGWWRLECVSNLEGCGSASISSSVYDNYQLRTQDHGARLRLMGALLWLRDQIGDQRSLSDLLADLPDEYTSPTRRPELSEDGTALRIRQFDTSRGEYWEIPLPLYLQESAL